MNNTKIFFLMSCCLLTINIFANNKGIYGEDNRLDIFEVSNPLHIQLAKSTLAMIPNDSITADGDNFNISGIPLGIGLQLCEGEKFANQPYAASCSAFLVTPKHIVTAGHCVDTLQSCNKSKWVFDYSVTKDGNNTLIIPKSNVYGCKKIIKRVFSSFWSKNDYAFIELDREVTDREPLKVRTSGKVSVNDPLVVIGHPSGLPVKVAAGAIVRTNNKSKYFMTNLDAFGGNSGSAVFNSETGIVEGILVRGGTDYIIDNERECRMTNHCSETGCRGEGVTRITNIKALMKMLKNK